MEFIPNDKLINIIIFQTISTIYIEIHQYNQNHISEKGSKRS